MADLIFNSTVEGFAYSKTTADGEDLYKAEISTGAPVITAGETYTVVLDGLQYVCAAQEDTISGESGVVVGNPTITDSGGTNSGEPFLYMYNAAAGTGSITTLLTESAHTVEMYTGLVENESNVVIAERVYTFSNGSDSDIYSTSVNNIAMEAGEVYTVFWDGTRRVCTAAIATVYGTEAVVIGDQSIDPELFPDGEDTDEEFLLGYVAAYSMTVFETLETNRMHTVAVYKGEVEEDGGWDGDEIILAEQTISGFGESYYGYMARTADLFVPQQNAVYRVVWDGVEHICLADATTTGIVYLGNTALQNNVGFHDNSGEEFCIEYVPAGNENAGEDAFIRFFSSSEEASHTVYIYQNAEKDANVVVPSRLFTFAMNDMVNELTWTGKTTFGFVVGDTYTVEWEGTKYVCQAKTVSLLGETGVGVGNTAIYGDENDTGEPFLFFTVTALTGGWGFTNDETKDTFTASIYKGELEDDSGEEVGKVILENRTVKYSEDEGFWIALNDDGTGPYLTDGLFSLTEGKTYTIVIDGVEYTGEATTATVEGLGEVIGIGNADAFTGGEGNGEPYAAGFMQADVNASAFIFLWFDTATQADTYTVSLYEGDITAGDDDTTTDGYLLKDAELAFELETNSETVYYNNEVAPVIIAGKTYTVIWDGNYYDCVAKEYTEADGDVSLTFVTLGNLNIQHSSQEDTKEPFVYLYLNYAGNNVGNFKTLEKDASHVISIYDGVLEHPAVTNADIYTYDQNGNAVLHEKRSTVTFDTPDGRYAVFKLSHISDSRS